MGRTSEDFWDATPREINLAIRVHAKNDEKWNKRIGMLLAGQYNPNRGKGKKLLTWENFFIPIEKTEPRKPASAKSIISRMSGFAREFTARVGRQQNG